MTERSKLPLVATSMKRAGTAPPPSSTSVLPASVKGSLKSSTGMPLSGSVKQSTTSQTISRDKLAYFKDNVADNIEDFDPTEYYYHRQDKDMNMAPTMSNPPMNAGLGIQNTSAPISMQKQILTHSGSTVLPAPTNAPMMPGSYMNQYQSNVYSLQQPPAQGRMQTIPQILPNTVNSSQPRAAPTSPLKISGGAELRPQIQIAQPNRNVNIVGMPNTAVPGSQPQMVMNGPTSMSRSAAGIQTSNGSVNPLINSSITQTTAASQAGSQRVLLRERSFSGGGTAGGGGAAAAAGNSRAPTQQQQIQMASGISPRAIPSNSEGATQTGNTLPVGARQQSSYNTSGTSNLYSIMQKPGTSGVGITYQMNDNVVNKQQHEMKIMQEEGLINGVPSFDINDFPALSRTGTTPPSGSSIPMMNHSEFSIQNEDFPALPGSSTYSKNFSDVEKEEAKALMGIHPGQSMALSQQFPSGNSNQSLALSSMNHDAHAHTLRASYDETSNGAVVSQQHHGRAMRHMHSSTPPSTGTIGDKFGLLGILSIIRMVDPDLNILALGTDLTTLGLNLNSADTLYPTFSSPWTDSANTRRFEPEYYLPLCYYMQAPMQPPQLKLPLFSEDTLFYIFYSMPKDLLQVAAAYELYNRDWRYHKELQRWFTRVQGTEPSVKTATYERGSYIYYEFTTGEKMRKDNFTLVYELLEDRPVLHP